MPFDEYGYTKKKESEILEEKEELYKDLFDVINNSISDIQWQWMKLQLIERMEIENLLEVATEQMSISDAQGAFLDKWGIECGITRKGETRAEGYVDVTYKITDSDFSIPAGTRFASSTNTYTSDEDDSIPRIITMTKTKTGESDDYFPSSIVSVENVDKILDSNLSEISSSYWVFDTTYKNNIQWKENSSDVIIKNEVYYVYVSGNVTKRIEVTSSEAGVDSNASKNTVTTCLDFPTLICDNSEEITGGAAQESDSDYRDRLLAARRRTFTLASVRSIIMGLNGVRAVKVFQTLGVDQSSVSDWDNPNKGSPVVLSGYEYPMYSQAFVPGEQIATLGRITLYGRPVNDPPPIYVGLKKNIDSYDEDDYFDYVGVEKYEIDQTTTGTRDIHFDIKYNGMDRTDTYRFDVWCGNPNNDSFDWNSNHWILETSSEGYRNDSRGAFYHKDSSTSEWIDYGTGIDLMFKTHFNGAGFNCIVAVEDGYGFENVKSEIENYLDYVENGGYSPVCIQSTIEEATEILIDIRATIYITSLADFQVVRNRLTTSLENYLEGLNIGDNVIYSRIYQIIMNDEDVYKIEDLYIKREDSSTWGQSDIGILDTEIPDLGTKSFQRG